MSSIPASSAALPSTSPSPCAAKLYDIPVQVASCAMPYSQNHTNMMLACCGSASVISYYNNCGLFCLAQGQTVHDLMDCLFQHGAGYSDVFCRGKTTAEASGMATVAASASAHVVGAAASPTQSGVGSTSSSASSGIAPGFGSGSDVSMLRLLTYTLLILPVWLV